MDDHDAPRRLADGFRKFRTHYYDEDPTLYQKLVQNGQSPRVMMVACADSRIMPSRVFNPDPGDLFVVRNVANLVPPAELDGHLHGTSAAVDFAVEQLRVEHIIINGHSHCGGIKSLFDGAEGRYMQPWVEIAKDARADVLAQHADASPEQQEKALEQAAILISMENLLSFDSVRRRVIRGDLEIHGWYFDLDKGQLLRYERKTRSFEQLV
ncbi:MAG TPA: carbonic anhydrase [Acidiferrobacter sp.]|nr:carbonic anhydrase [Acidiferrobacter sp.]